MILFGHLGLTYGAFEAGKKKFGLPDRNMRIDYRLLFIGSVLPDLIDKTIIFFMSDETVRSGRLIAHSLIFSLLFLCIGYYFYKKKNNSNLLVLAFSSFIHQIFDSMWNYMDIYFWPFFGMPLNFSKSGLDNWINQITGIFNKKNPDVTLNNVVERLMSHPLLTFFEIAGFIIIVMFVVKLVKRGQVIKFIKTGNVG